MTTDIVERLRNRQLHDMEYVDAMTREAADEIERLQAENAMLRATLQDYANHDRRALEPR